MIITDDATFDVMVRRLISAVEGEKETNDPDDPGGRTRWGISELFLKQANLPAPKSIDDAIKIYKDHFWNPYGCRYLQPRLAWLHFLNVVNLPAQRAVEMLQESLNQQLSQGEQLKVDGIVGPNTLFRMTTANEDIVLTSLRLRAIQYYMRKIKESPKKMKNFEGWFNRVFVR